jgi:hypothetical protein
MTQQIEHSHQKALIAWSKYTHLPPASDLEHGSRVFDYLLAIPNGGLRGKVTAAKLKAEGVKPGVSDLLLPLRRQGFAGLWLELKAPGNKPTESQGRWLARMTRAGYRAEWADSWDKAAVIIADYVGVIPPATIAPPKLRFSAYRGPVAAHRARDRRRRRVRSGCQAGKPPRRP